MTTCIHCKNKFEITNLEKNLLKKINLPEPTECPPCRMQRRFSFRNERKLYYRRCDLTGKQIVSIYAPDSKYKVYNQPDWYSDKWDAMDYGRSFDSDKNFFEQMSALMLDVPKLSAFVSNNENSDYTNGAQQDKDCYMIFVSDHDEDCYYSYGIDSCKDCLECLNCYKSTLCIECVDCSDCYSVVMSEKSHNCSSSYFLSDCKNCKDCIACYGLRGKKYCILNEQYSKEEYETRKKDLNMGNLDNLKQMKEFFEQKVNEQQIHQYIDGNNNENSTGDHIVGCKDCIECYDSGDLQDCSYLIFSFKSKDCSDGHVVVDNCELCYETVSTINQYNTQFTFASYYSKNSMYLDSCIACEDCFACSGLKKKKYCIFNKQYSQENYEALKVNIIEHMKKPSSGGQAGEWGRSFPTTISPFGYNETVAYEFFPLDKKEVLKKGWKWHEEDKNDSAYQGPKVDVPKNIKETNKDITEKVLTCEKCSKLYKISPQELKLYKFHNIPIARMCFDDRHLARLSRRNPRKLWERKCMKCGIELESSYSPEKSEIIYCEKCYLESVY